MRFTIKTTTTTTTQKANKIFKKITCDAYSLPQCARPDICPSVSLNVESDALSDLRYRYHKKHKTIPVPTENRQFPSRTRRSQHQFKNLILLVVSLQVASFKTQASFRGRSNIELKTVCKNLAIKTCKFLAVLAVHVVLSVTGRKVTPGSSLRCRSRSA